MDVKGDSKAMSGAKYDPSGKPVGSADKSNLVPKAISVSYAVDSAGKPIPSTEKVVVTLGPRA